MTDSTWIKSAKIGGLGIAEQVCLGNVLDMTKFEKQRTGRPYPRIAASLYSRGVLRAHTLGMWPWGVGMYFTRGCTYGGMRMALDPHLPSSPVASSALAGMVEGVCTAPWNMARVRIAECHSTGEKLVHLDARILWRSLPVLSIKRALDWGLRTALQEPIGRALPSSDAGHFTGAFLSGMVSTVMTTPIDRMVPVLQQRQPPPLREWWRRQSVHSWMAGGWARALHGGWHTMFILGGLHWLGPAQTTGQ